MPGKDSNRVLDVCQIDKLQYLQATDPECYWVKPHTCVQHMHLSCSVWA